VYGGKLMCISRRLKTLTPSGDKAIVATTFATLLPLAQAAFRAEGIDAEVLSGPPAQRARAVQNFQTKPRARVLLLSIGADCAGLTLTAANHLFVLDPVLSPQVMGQLAGRICRQGQVKPCFVYHMAVAGSVEERIIAMRCVRASAGEHAAGAGDSCSGTGDGDANAAIADQLSAVELLRLLDGSA
jgi:SNF2 family DNA or RNA helicase